MANVIGWSVFLGIFLALLEDVTGYYCDNDKCLEDQFCCGENICCVSYRVWELWYFWCGLLFCLLLLSLCGCFWQQRQRAYWVFHTTTAYRPLNPEEDVKYNHLHKGRSMSPQFSTPNTGNWYSPHPTGSLPAKAYADNEHLYDTEPRRKPDY